MVEFATGREQPVALFCPEEMAALWEPFSIELCTLPAVDELLSPFLYVIPLQLFAYHVALLRDSNPDRPEGFDNIAIQKMIYTGLLEGWHEEEQE